MSYCKLTFACLFSVQISKGNVDHYSGERTIPKCILLLVWTRKDTPVCLDHKISLSGAKNCSFFTLYIPAASEYKSETLYSNVHNYSILLNVTSEIALLHNWQINVLTKLDLVESTVFYCKVTTLQDLHVCIIANFRRDDALRKWHFPHPSKLVLHWCSTSSCCYVDVSTFQVAYLNDMVWVLSSSSEVQFNL